MTVNAFEVIAELSSVRLRGARPATGNIWVNLAGKSFPSPGWNDFVVVILDALLASVLRLANHGSSREIVHFMEGPYELHMLRQVDGQLAITAQVRGRGAIASVLVDEATVIASLMSCTSSVVERCRDDQASSDLRRLCASFDAVSSWAGRKR